MPTQPTEPSRWSVDELIPFGKYILLNKISSGAIAAVYRAKLRGEAGFERLVTIKRILPQMAGDPEFVETFVREAKLCARLNHGSICPIYELGKVGESLYMTLEWVSGKDMGAIMRRLQRNDQVMPPLLAAWIASRLCDALDYAHGLKDNLGKRVGLLHQDVSPNNIVISYEGEVKLIDFGIARASGRAQQTNVEALKQKLGYMSPELVLGTALDARSDVFAVGVVLYEMVTGRRLFAGGDDIATLKLVSSAAVPPPSALLEDTPEELEMIMMRALARDPESRWQSAGEMAQALTACIAAEDPTYGPRNVAEFMNALFAEDRAAEQRRQNDLIAASQDAKLIEERRRFFASPSGAAAIAKAEAARKHASNRPPPPKAQASVPAPPPPAPIEVDEDELTTYKPERGAGKRLAAPEPAGAFAPAASAPQPARLPNPGSNTAAAAGIAPQPSRLPAPGKPAPPAAAIPKPPEPAGRTEQVALAPAPSVQLAPPEPAAAQPPVEAPQTRSSNPPDPEALTRAATFEEMMRGNADADSAGTKLDALDEELTTFQPERGARDKAAASAFQSDASSQADHEATTLRPEHPQPALEEKTAEHVHRALEEKTAEHVHLADTAEHTTLGDAELQELADTTAPPPAADEEEKTSYYEHERPKPSGTELLDALVAARGPFEEEATQIFFSAQEGIGIVPDVPDDELTTVAHPTPLLVQSPSGQRPRGAGVSQRLAPVGPLGTLGTGQHQPVKVEKALGSWAERDEQTGIAPQSTPPANARGPVIWIAAALLLVTLFGLVWKTQLGVQLGLRKPPDGVIEIRTLPEVPASVRLDGIYRGRAPLRLEGVPSGERTLTLEADGYEPVKRTIALEGGATMKENVTLNPQPSAAASSTP